eukprot:NODE_222_length_12365_cov_0.759009.p2 type:complete len:300 gc:universal NODE_222_length_12365_cov_0.759009:11027-11926(+)
MVQTISTILAEIRPVNTICNILMDTGASHCFMSEATAFDLQLKIKPAKLDETESANGSKLTIIGFAQCSVYYSQTPVKHNFYIIRNLASNIIIGRDSMRLQNMNIDFERNFIWINGMPIRMNRSPDEVAVQTAMLNYVSTSKNSKLKKFQLQEILKDITNDYDLHSEDIVLPNEKDDNSPRDLVINDKLTEEQQQELRNVANQFLPCFGSENKTRVRTRHHIRTDCEPVRAGIIKEECEKMLKEDRIEHSCFDWRSSVVLIPKPDGSVRFCVNYKLFNKQTNFDAYPLPNLQSLLSKLQ